MTTVGSYCTACGAENPSDAFFCTECGSRLSTPAVPTNPAAWPSEGGVSAPAAVAADPTLGPGNPGAPRSPHPQADSSPSVAAAQPNQAPPAELAPQAYPASPAGLAPQAYPASPAGLAPQAYAAPPPERSLLPSEAAPESFATTPPQVMPPPLITQVPVVGPARLAAAPPSPSPVPGAPAPRINRKVVTLGPPPEKRDLPLVARSWSGRDAALDPATNAISRNREIAFDLPQWEPLPPGESVVSRGLRS